MAVTVGSPLSGRSLEKLFEDAEQSGKLLLRNRRLKDIGQFAYKHELKDISYVDLTHNRLHELPTDAYDWHCCETLLLSHNIIKLLPDFISDFKLLQVLDLSNNQLSSLSHYICQIRSLRVLLVANNKIVSIPEEISNLSFCEHLDISCNSLAALPVQIADMKNLKCLNISRNSIQSLPEKMSRMEITHLNASCNNISILPISFRNFPCIEELNMDNNPLTSPPLTILRKGHIHAFKELSTAADKMQIKKDVMDDPILSPRKMGGDVDFHMFDIGSRSWSNSVSDKTAEMYATEAANLSKGRRQKSNPSSPEKRVKDVARSSSVRVLSSKKLSTQTTSTVDVKPVANNNKTVSEAKVQQGNPKITATSTTASKKISSALYPVSNSNGMVRKNSKDALLSKEKVNGTTSPVDDDKKQTKEQLRDFVKHRKALSPTSDNAIRKGDISDVLKPRAISAGGRRRGNTMPDSDQSFTVRRKNEKIYEEIELIETLQQNIESRLKVTIGGNIQDALSNGIILCQLTNHVRPRSIPSIHVPSPAVPVLSRAKSRRNVDNFIETCKKIGVPPNLLCSSQDILEQKNISQVSLTVQELLKKFPGSGSPRKAVSQTVVKIAHTKSQSAV